jgi:hypothetical protein
VVGSRRASVAHVLDKIVDAVCNRLAFGTP